MESRRFFLLMLLVGAIALSSCSRADVGDASKASMGANPPVPKMLDRRMLEVSGFHNLNEFIRPEVRERLDKEPVGDGYEVVERPAVSDASSIDEPSGENGIDEDNTDLDTRNRDLENVKFSWARKKFGDALVADPAASGAIVLYADDAYYDIYKMLHSIDLGRDRIAADGGFDASRIQVIFGGYRGKAQVEMWIIPQGQSLPEAKPEKRESPTESNN